MKYLSLQFAIQFLRLARAIHKLGPTYSNQQFAGEVCPACGQRSELVMNGVLWPELVLQWELSPAWANWIDQREGLRCQVCRANLRSRQLAKSIVSVMNAHLGLRAGSLSGLCSDSRMQSQRVAEINAAGDLHSILRTLPRLEYSEFQSKNPEIRSEDLLNLSYSSSTFDLVITSDVLEHVPNVQRALTEIRRILKPNGMHIFSVPVIWNKPRSRKRAEIRNGTLVHHLPASHHGAAHGARDDFLVFNEFGRDFVQLCEQAGFDVTLIDDRRNPSLVTFVTSRHEV